MRVALVGGVQTTAAALDSLMAHGAEIVGVLGYAPKNTANVSGYVDVAHYAQSRGVPSVARFVRVNDSEVIETLRIWRPDVLMVIGLSQMVSASVRETARKLAVGFHPTRLPQGRGRAPIAWLILRREHGAATLFELYEEADAGNILAQVEYGVEMRDHAQNVMDRAIKALDLAIQQFVERYEDSSLRPKPQSPHTATHWGVRKPEDGQIDWGKGMYAVDALVRATSRPHPGAYTITPNGHKLVFMYSFGPLPEHIGVPGRVLAIAQDHWVVACGDGGIKLGGIEGDETVVASVRIGDRLNWRIGDADRRASSF